LALLTMPCTPICPFFTKIANVKTKGHLSM
jgi:hypothetical protein